MLEAWSLADSTIARQLETVLSSLMDENSSGSCFAQTTCFIFFQYGFTRLTASAEKLIMGVGAESLVFTAESTIRK